MKLWDYEHPYYMSEGCYHKAGCTEIFYDWNSFIDSWGNTDVDMNRIHRWDFNEEKDTVTFYYVMQRKAYTYSVAVKIEEKDLAAIKEFLIPHAKLNEKLWKGIL